MRPALDPSETHLSGRVDLELIASLVEPRTRVLDLGCGDGTLLSLLRDERAVTGRGVEISKEGVLQCVQKGLTVYHGNLDEGLGDYPDGSFDYVILSQTLQAVGRPEVVLEEMFRVGRVGIVSFPNFGYWRVRWQLLTAGRMPKADYLPYEWYDTPNIHLLTVKDFHTYCLTHKLKIERACYLNEGWEMRVWPNLLAKLAIFVVKRA